MSASPLLLAQVKPRIPGLGLHPLAFSDLMDLCEVEGIEVFRMPFDRLYGCAFINARRPYIFVNSTLPVAEQTIAGFHETCHLIRDLPDWDTDACPCVFASNGSLYRLSRIERDAQIIGVLAVMPDVGGMSIEDIMREFGVGRRTAEFRVSLGI